MIHHRFRLYFLNYRMIWNFFLAVFLAFTIINNAEGQTTSVTNSGNKSEEFDIKNESFLLPQPLPSGKYTSAIYLLDVFIPPDWTLDVIKAPMIVYSGKL